jgi:outer membrane protein
MKKINVIALAVLGIAIAFLYAHYFSHGFKGKKPETKVADITNLTNMATQVAFVNMDTLLAHYQYYLDLRNDLQAKQEKTGADLQAKFNNWQKQATKLEDDRQKLLITSRTYEENGQRLVQERDNLLQLQQNLSQQLAEEETVMNRKVYFAIVEYVKEFNKDGKYHYILSNSLGGNILYASDNLDLTSLILEGLNKKYLEVKK